MGNQYSKKKYENLQINTFLNKHWIKEEIKRKVEQYLETQGNKNKAYQKFWDPAKALQM